MFICLAKNGLKAYIYLRVHGGLIMKKLVILLALSLLVACGAKDDKPETPETPDVVTVASISDKADVVEKSLGTDGNWITAALADVTYTSDVTVDGTFHDKGADANAVYRKLALHTQDDAYNILENFVMTTPKLIVKSENFTVFYGTIKGDVEVHANGFALVGTKVEGNVTFAKEEYKESALLDKDDAGATITGEVTVLD